jgi:hypothetical protein
LRKCLVFSNSASNTYFHAPLKLPLIPSSRFPGSHSFPVPLAHYATICNYMRGKALAFMPKARTSRASWAQAPRPSAVAPRNWLAGSALRGMAYATGGTARGATRPPRIHISTQRTSLKIKKKPSETVVTVTTRVATGFFYGRYGVATHLTGVTTVTTVTT